MKNSRIEVNVSIKMDVEKLSDMRESQLAALFKGLADVLAQVHPAKAACLDCQDNDPAEAEARP